MRRLCASQPRKPLIHVNATHVFARPRRPVRRFRRQRSGHGAGAGRRRASRGSRDDHRLCAPAHAGHARRRHGDRDRPGAHRGDARHRHPRTRALRARAQRAQRPVPFRPRHDLGPRPRRQSRRRRDRRHPGRRRLCRRQLCRLGPRLCRSVVRRPRRVPARAGIVALRQRCDRRCRRDDDGRTGQAARVGRQRPGLADRGGIRLGERRLARCGAGGGGGRPRAVAARACESRRARVRDRSRRHAEPERFHEPLGHAQGDDRGAGRPTDAGGRSRPARAVDLRGCLPRGRPLPQYDRPRRRRRDAALPCKPAAIPGTAEPGFRLRRMEHLLARHGDRPGYLRSPPGRAAAYTSRATRPRIRLRRRHAGFRVHGAEEPGDGLAGP